MKNKDRELELAEIIRVKHANKQDYSFEFSEYSLLINDRITKFGKKKFASLYRTDKSVVDDKINRTVAKILEKLPDYNPEVKSYAMFINDIVYTYFRSKDNRKSTDKRVSAAKNKFHSEYGYDPTAQELYDFIKEHYSFSITLERIQISLNPILYSQEIDTLGKKQSTKTTNQSNGALADLARDSKSLSKIEKKIVILKDEKGMTLSEIGKKLNKNKSTISVIYKTALAKIFVELKNRG